MQPRDSDEGTAGKSNDEIVIEIVDAIMEKLPDWLDISDAGKDTFIMDKAGVLESLASFLK